jgi:hypothetical protein
MARVQRLEGGPEYAPGEAGEGDPGLAVGNLARDSQHDEVPAHHRRLDPEIASPADRESRSKGRVRRRGFAQPRRDLDRDRPLVLDLQPERQVPQNVGIDEVELLGGHLPDERWASRRPAALQMLLRRDGATAHEREHCPTPARVEIRAGRSAAHEPAESLGGRLELEPDGIRDPAAPPRAPPQRRHRRLRAARREEDGRPQPVAIDELAAELETPRTRPDEQARGTPAVEQQHQGRSEDPGEPERSPLRDPIGDLHADVCRVALQRQAGREGGHEAVAPDTRPGGRRLAESGPDRDRRHRNLGLPVVGRDRAAPGTPNGMRVRRVEANAVEDQRSDQPSEVDRSPVLAEDAVLMLDPDDRLQRDRP